jgi:drug/metabolite transporter (DMT)-like permease
MAFMLLATVGFSMVSGMIRHVSADLHPFEIVFFTSLFGFPVVLPWLVRDGIKPLRTKHLGLHFLRVAMGVTAMMIAFFAISFTPLALVTALNFLSPIFTAVIAVLFLGEVMRIRRWIAILVGFAGTLVVLRPGIEPIEFGAMLMLISALFGGTAMLCIKLLGRTDTSVTITCYAVALRSPMALIPALFVWQWPTGTQLLWLSVMGILFTASTMSLAQAFRDAEANVVAPVFFFQLIWTAAIGYVFFAEVPALYTWIGAAMIFASTTYVAYRERVNQPSTPITVPTLPPA